MADTIAILSTGLWRLRDEVASLTGLAPRRALWRAVTSDAAVAGWGHKPTAARARREALRLQRPYIAFEDGFLRSLRPGPAERPAAMVVDRSGIYYDARQPSDLETMLEEGAITAAECAQAAALLAGICRHRLSKYNSGNDCLGGADIPASRPIVLAIDQTRGDESVAGGLADAASFERMLAAAVAENPNATVIAKLHPETIAGNKRGYLDAAALPAGVLRLAETVNPWALLERAPAVYTVSSQFGFEALLAGCRVVCFGAPFYAGWGLTDDRVPVPRRTARPSREALAAAAYLRYCKYFDLWRRGPVDAATAVDQLAFRRRQFLRNDKPVIGYRIARWKRRAVAAMLDGPHGPPRFVNDKSKAAALAKARGGVVAAWGREALRWRETVADVPCLAVEDGFIRSAGLGAALVPPLSLVFDARGLYFDPRQPSDLEHMLATVEFEEAKLGQARALRERLVAEQVTKYNLAGSAPQELRQPGRVTVLVPGQVSDDWAVRLGFTGAGHGVNINAVLLAAVRAGGPRKYVIFKPHPDVERLGRAGRLTPEEEIRLADLVLRGVSLEQVLGLVDRIETFTSLAGFEGLLRGIPVKVHGLPFYAGWGLTDDLAPSPRRGRRRSLDELVAATLIDYPRYWDPVSGLSCPPDVVLDRLAALRRHPASVVRTLAGRTIIIWRKVAAALGARE